MSTVVKPSQQLDFELNQFAEELYFEIDSLAESEANGATTEDVFTEHVLNVLADAGETEGPVACRYEKDNKWEKTELKVNGFSLDDAHETLDLFVSDYRHSRSPQKVSKPDFDNLVKCSTAFANVVLKGYEDSVEPSAKEVFGLVSEVSRHRNLFIRVNIFLLSNGQMPYDPPKNVRLKGFDELVINYHVWDIERLHRLSQSKSNRDPIEIDFESNLGEVIPCLEMPSSGELYECYLAIVPGKVLSTLYRNYGTRLLESNVRAFLQQTGKVNKGIMDTIRNNPEMFLPYNNGLAATAMEVHTSEKDGKRYITSVKDFQIVNGGQTTASLFHTESKFKVDLSKVFVQMKLTVIKDEEEKNKAVPDISRYANSQNKVSELDLSSNNPILQRLEELSRTTYAIDPEDRNKQSVWFFERVKGQYKEAFNKEPTPSKKEAFKKKYPRHQLIIKSEIAKYMNLWNQLPHHVVKGAEKNYNIYLKAVGDEFKKKRPSRVYWEDIIANAILFRTADELFGRKGADPIGDTNIKAHSVAYGLAYLHHITENGLNLKLIWDGQIVPDDLKGELRKAIKYGYDFLNSLGVSLISETAKSEKIWDKMKADEQHPFDMDVLKRYLISDADKKARYSDEEDEVEQAARMNDMKRITDLGIKFWDGLDLYAVDSDMFSQAQRNVIGLINGKLKKYGNLTPREIAKGVEIIDQLFEQGLTSEAIASRSKLAESTLIDPAALYQRLQSISKETWKQIVALGEKTGKLEYKEISVIKAVEQLIRRKEPVDLRRLEVTVNAIDKLKKYGLKA
jgi:hypothetical protein